MWRCVPGSTFFTAELCNPGDRELMPGTTLPALGATIAGMSLDRGLTNDLTHRLDDIAKKLDGRNGTADACNGLGDLVQQLFDAAGADRPQLTIAQAQQIVSTAGAIGESMGCDDADPLTPTAQAEQDVLTLIGTVNGMPLDRGLAGDLRGPVRDVGRQLAHGQLSNACRSLDDLGTKIADTTGKKNGLTAAQATTLQTARAAIATELGC
jgi:hypothetical protein